jgi:hypothetical protein
MPIAFYNAKTQYLATALPAWVGPATFAPLASFTSILLRHSPHCQLSHAKDSAFLVTPQATLTAAIKHTLQNLDRQGVKYTPESWDCEDFVNEVHGTLRKMAAIAGHRGTPLTCCISVAAINPWANVKSGGFHALLATLTENGVAVSESQNGITTTIETYPNRTTIVQADNF